MIMAFFPCIYFSCLSQMAMTWGYTNYRKKTYKERSDLILQRAKDREKFYSLAVKMLTIAKERGLRLIMENPWSMQTYLKANFVIPPSLVDKDRSLRGDHFKKETAYWFINCEPTHGETLSPRKPTRVLDAKPGAHAGLCSEERSMISPVYARNFICDFVLGKVPEGSTLTLF